MPEVNLAIPLCDTCDNTEPLPAGAGRIGDVLFEVLKYDVFRDGTVGGREIPSAPKAPPPIAALQLREFALHLVGGAALHQPHQIAHRQFRRHGNEHVDMINRQHAADDVDALFAADLATNVPDPQPDITG